MNAFEFGHMVGEKVAATRKRADAALPAPAPLPRRAPSPAPGPDTRVPPADKNTQPPARTLYGALGSLVPGSFLPPLPPATPENYNALLMRQAEQRHTMGQPTGLGNNPAPNYAAPAQVPFKPVSGGG